MNTQSLRTERRLEPFVLAATILVIPLIVIEESSFGQPWDSIGVLLNWASWLTFVIEAIVMIRVCPRPSEWIRKHPVDLAVVVLTPPFLSFLAPIRLLRLLRLLRLVRLAPLARRLFSIEGLQYVAVLAALTVVAGGAAFANVESGHSTAEGMYWAITTMTTVGGDVTPETTAGHVLGIVVVLVGIGFVAILTGAVAQRFLAGEIADEVSSVEEDIEHTGTEVLRRLGDLRTRLDELEALVRSGGAAVGGAGSDLSDEGSSELA